MAETLCPRTASELARAVAWAAAEGEPLEVVAGGTKRGFGHAVAGARRLDLARLEGVRCHEPAELVLTAAAATPLVDVKALLERSRQQLAFEPPDLGPLFGAPAAGATLGGVLAANLSGPRRILAGAARDHALGVEMVTGRGEVVKAGGRVVKNVSGYDVTKLVCGSWGTLAVLTEVTVKVLPLAERTRTVLVLGLDAPAAQRALNAALASPHEVSGAAFLPPRPAARSALPELRGAGASSRSVAAFRLEGPAVSVGARRDALCVAMAGEGRVETLESAPSLAFWRELRDATLLPAEAETVWRLVLPPAAGAEVLAALEARGCEGWLDWGGGLIWLAAGAGAERARGVRRRAEAAGGHATLVRGPESLKREVGAFPPQPAARRALCRRIRQGFDPAGILNPGRLGSDDADTV